MTKDTFLKRNVTIHHLQTFNAHHTIARHFSQSESVNHIVYIVVSGIIAVVPATSTKMFVGGSSNECAPWSSVPLRPSHTIPAPKWPVALPHIIKHVISTAMAPITLVPHWSVVIPNNGNIIGTATPIAASASVDTGYRWSSKLISMRIGAKPPDVWFSVDSALGRAGFHQWRSSSTQR